MTAVTRFDIVTLLIDTRYALREAKSLRAEAALRRVEDRLQCLLDEAITSDEDAASESFDDALAY